MKLISDLTEKEISHIVEILTLDGFKNIKVTETSIIFSEGSKIKRDYELISTDLDNEDDLGIRMDFDFEKFMLQNYIHKTRHSVSLKDAIEATGSTEDACDKLEWKIVQVKDLNKDPHLWHAGLHADVMYELHIGTAPHIILNDEVYEGDLSRLWSMGDKSARELLAGYRISSFLKNL